MTILAKFEKQPSDIQDFDIDYTEWLTGMSDTAPGPATLTPGPNCLVVTADDGITITATALLNGVVKVYTSGGTSGTTYKIVSTLTTVGGRTKQAEIKVKVKDY